MILYKIYDKASNQVWYATYHTIEEAKEALHDVTDLEDSLYEIFHYEKEENGHFKCVTDWRSI